MKKQTFFLFRVILLVALSGVMESPTVVFAADSTSCEGNPPVGGTNGWQQHFIDGGKKCPDPDSGPLFGTSGADGVDIADFDGDCDMDIVTGWEESSNVILYLNPLLTPNGSSCSVDYVDSIDNDQDGQIDEDGYLLGINRDSLNTLWPTVDISGGQAIKAVEDAVFGDANGDGQVDFIVSATEGGDSKTVYVHRFTGNRFNAGDVLNPTNWSVTPLPNNGLPKLKNMRAQVGNINGDGAYDIVVGSKDGDADISWWAGPDFAQRYVINGDIKFTMQLSLFDMDGDSDQDVLYGDRDDIAWVENPGTAMETSAWVKHKIDTVYEDCGNPPCNSAETFRWSTYSDIDGDGWEEIVTTTNYGMSLGDRDTDRGVMGRWYDRLDCPTFQPGATCSWKVSTIGKYEILVADATPADGGTIPFYWDKRCAEDLPIFGCIEDTFNRVSKAVAVGDVNSDGKTDLLFTARGGERDPQDTSHPGYGSGVFYLTHSGSYPPRCMGDTCHTADNMWQISRVSPSYRDMKYDNIALIDFDMDGDLDAATVEENAGEDKGLGVVWYENHRPSTAYDDTAITPEDTPFILDVLNNEQAANFNPASVQIVTGPSSGSAQPQNGKILYIPAPNFNGVASFIYQACNADNMCDQARVTVNVTPVNDAPIANSDAVSTVEGQVLTVSSPGVLGNDGDVDADGLSAAVHIDPAHGDLTLASNGGFSYAPVQGFCGVDSFIYAAYDGHVFSRLATVTINVQCINDPPVAHNDNVNAVEDTTLNVAAPGVLANDSDPDGNALTAVLSANASHGMVTLNPNGRFQYVPAANYCGSDSFTYLANDGQANSGVATVTCLLLVSTMHRSLAGHQGLLPLMRAKLRQTAVPSAMWKATRSV